MAERVFKFPGFFGSETDLTSRTITTTGIPAGLIGASQKGPAFVPVTMGSFNDFITKFGDLNSNFVAPYAAEKFLANRPALTFIRILGGGANATTTNFETTRTQGTVVNAGFRITGSLIQGTPSPNRDEGFVQFIVAKHLLTGSEARGNPMFTDNGSFLLSGAIDEVNLVRGVIFAATGTLIIPLDHNQVGHPLADDMATVNSTTRLFKLMLSTSQGTTFGSDDGVVGARIYTASLDPDSDHYFAKVLNTDPTKFHELRHYVYADYAVDHQIASVHTGTNMVAIVQGSGQTSLVSGDTALEFKTAFGKFNTRFKTAKTPSFISQPYGGKEYDLFYVEALDDGVYPNERFKISITNIIGSTNPRYEYGTFTVLVREFEDSDLDPRIIEQFANCTLDPESDTYLAKVVGDIKTKFNFDVENADDRRLVKTGKYPNRSKHVRVVMNQQVEDKLVPATVLPFGFRGPNLLKTNPILTDTTSSATNRMILATSGTLPEPRLNWALVPPIPYRFKVTRGQVSTGSGQLTGAPGTTEIVDSRFYWGTKFERNNNDILNPNVNNEINALIRSVTKFPGIDKLDVVVTGSKTDVFNDNKFTLARIALGNAAFTDITASSLVHMKEACYIRNGSPDVTNYAISDGSPAVNRLTFASLIHSGSIPTLFNKFSSFAKFTVCMFGGFDGINILDSHAAAFDDRSTSTEARETTRGGANSSFTSPGFGFNQNGGGLNNNHVFSYRTAIDIITDPVASNINLLAIPGQREPFITDYASEATKDFGLAMYLMDIPNYNADSNRVFDGETANSATYVNIEKTADTFEGRALDNTFVGTYFPDVVIDDTKTARKVTVPSTVAALSAIGFNDKVAYPWFAPAGFNRAALSFVSLTRARLKQSDRERMYQVRVNPIVKFPGEGFVIFSQKTLDANQTALDSINVQRMIIDVERQIIDIGNRLIFENITPELRTQFVSSTTTVLANVQNRGGLQKFKIVCDETNNTDLDTENNRMNAKLFLLPVKAVEFIAIDFVIGRSGISFST